MAELRVLNRETVEKVIDMKSTIEAVEQAYTLKSSRKAFLFPMIFHEFEQGKADMDIKSGYLKGADIFGLKLVSWFGDNACKGLPTLIGTVLVLDSRTGVPLGILNGEYITCMRTGAAGGIAAKYLARKSSGTMLMVGSGHQAPYQISAVLEVMDNIERVVVYNPNSYDRAVDFCKAINRKHKGVFEATDNIREAVGQADIIVTATPSRGPLIEKQWVKPGTHITCIGADMEGKQEIDEKLFSGARIFVDDMTQATAVGECEIPVKKGVISMKDIKGEIGDVIMGNIPGRISDEDITIFDSTGIALQDLITADIAIKLAKEKGLGNVVEL